MSSSAHINVNQIVGKGASENAKSFMACFLPLSLRTADSRAFRKREWSKVDLSRNGRISLSDIELWVLSTLKANHGLQDGKKIFDFFRPIYRYTFGDVIDTVKNASFKNIFQFIRPATFRLFLAHLCVNALMYDAFTTMDNGVGESHYGGDGGNYHEDKDKRISLEEWKAGYKTVINHGLVALSKLVNDEKAAMELYEEIDSNASGLILYHQWCAVLKEAEIDENTAIGRLLHAGDTVQDVTEYDTNDTSREDDDPIIDDPIISLSIEHGASKDSDIADEEAVKESPSNGEPEIVRSAEPEIVQSAEPEIVQSSEPEVVANAEPEVVASSEQPERISAEADAPVKSASEEKTQQVSTEEQTQEVNTEIPKTPEQKEDVELPMNGEEAVAAEEAIEETPELEKDNEPADESVAEPLTQKPPEQERGSPKHAEESVAAEELAQETPGQEDAEIRKDTDETVAETLTPSPPEQEKDVESSPKGAEDAGAQKKSTEETPDQDKDTELRKDTDAAVVAESSTQKPSEQERENELLKHAEAYGAAEALAQDPPEQNEDSELRKDTDLTVAETMSSNSPEKEKDIGSPKNAEDAEAKKKSAQDPPEQDGNAELRKDADETVAEKVSQKTPEQARDTEPDKHTDENAAEKLNVASKEEESKASMPSSATTPNEAKSTPESADALLLGGKAPDEEIKKENGVATPVQKPAGRGLNETPETQSGTPLSTTNDRSTATNQGAQNASGPVDREAEENKEEQQKKMGVWACLCLLVIIIIVIVAARASNRNAAAPAAEPTTAPTAGTVAPTTNTTSPAPAPPAGDTITEPADAPATEGPIIDPVPDDASSNEAPEESMYDAVFEFLLANSYDMEEALSIANSPQNSAYKWMTTDPNIESYSGDTLLQRYTLGTLYYSLDGENWANNSGWLSFGDECQWHGTYCDEETGSVRILELKNNNLGGKLPLQLGLLSNMTLLDLSHNSLSGVLPHSVGAMRRLVILDVSENALSGTLPGRDIGLLSSLEELRLDSNSFEGQIPSDLGLIQDMEHGLSILNLQSNQFTGSLPVEIAELYLLDTLRIDDNSLSGSIPGPVCETFEKTNTTFSADCFQVECECCTYCCDPLIQNGCQCTRVGADSPTNDVEFRCLEE